MDKYDQQSQKPSQVLKTRKPLRCIALLVNETSLIIPFTPFPSTYSRPNSRGAVKPLFVLSVALHLGAHSR